MNREIQLHLDALMRSPAYWDAQDPQHEVVKDKVARVYAIEHEGANGQAEIHGRRVAPVVFDTAEQK